MGADPNHFAVVTTTVTRGAETAVATVTKDVSVHKNEAGGLDILLSPAAKMRFEAIAKQVTPCAKKRRRDFRNHKRQGGPACGLADFVQRVGADEELQANVAQPLTDQVWRDTDSAYGGDDPAEDPGWEGDGDAPGIDEADEGYFSDDDTGFFEGEEAGEGAGTAESVVFSSAEEAAAFGAALSGGEAAGAAALLGGSTLTASSFVAWLWGTLKDGKELAHAQQIPKENIHKVTKTKNKDDQNEDDSTTTADSCARPTDDLVRPWLHLIPPCLILCGIAWLTGVSKPYCEDGCEPTRVKNVEAQATGVVDWSCSAVSFTHNLSTCLAALCPLFLLTTRGTNRVSPKAACATLHTRR